MLAGGAAQPAPRRRDDPPPGRPGRLRPGADVPRAPGWPASWARGCRTPARSSLLPQLTIPVLSQIPLLGPIFFTRAERAGLRRLPARAARLVLDQPDPAGPPPARGRRVPGRGRRPGHRRLPAALRCTSFVGGLLAGLAGATITLAISPGWFGDQTVDGRGWIADRARDLRPVEPAPGGVRRLPLRGDLPVHPRHPGRRRRSSGIANPFQAGRSATFFLEMLPYVFVILVVIIGSREALRKRVGAPAALGRPVRPGRTRRLSAAAGGAVGYVARRVWTRGPSSSIWT